MKGEKNLYTAPFLTLAEIRGRWPDGELANDMVKGFHVSIVGHFGELVCPGFDLVAGQTLCDGYASTFNIGFIIKRMAQLLGLYEDDPRDFGEAIARQPVRIYSWGVCGGNYMDSICIGHFMDDRWLWGRDLMRTGLPKKGGAE